jgi:glycosyltransferase involved in cell wall biosynthesis
METLAGKKILFVITKSNWGGAQNYVYTLAEAATRAGARVTVAFGGTGGASAGTGLLDERLAAKGIRTVVISSFMRDISFVRDIRALFELISLMRSERPDVVHLNSSKAAGLGALAARIAGLKRIIFTAHGWPFWEQRSRSARALMYLFSWLTALLATKVVVVSDYDRVVASRMPGVAHKTVRIYNGIDLSTKLGAGDRIRSAFPKGAHITGTIGETNRNKNQIVLLEEALRESNRYVAIVGVDGDERPNLESYSKLHNLQDRVKLFGYVPWQEALPGFDEFVLPSLKEGLPTVLIEARLAGLPIRANRSIGGIAEILDTPDLTIFSEEHMIAETFALYYEPPRYS